MKQKTIFSCLIMFVIAFSFQSVTIIQAQSSDSDVSPKTQQYIDNVNDLQEAQNADKPKAETNQSKDSGSNFWKFAFYGFLSSVAYAFWRWVKRLKNN